LGYVDSPNLYQFLNRNPVNFLDPLGLATAAKIPEAPRLGHVAAWYWLEEEGYYVGQTVTGVLVDPQGRLLPLARQADLMSRYPFLQGPDNPGLAQLIRSPQLVKYSEQELLKIYGQWVLLNLTVVQVGGFATATVAGGLGLAELAGTAYHVGEAASKLLLAQSAATHTIQRDWKGVLSDLGSYIVGKVLEFPILRATELQRTETYILQSQANFFADLWGRKIAEILLDSVSSGRPAKSDSAPRK
jgi:hypothetical protein